MSLFQNSVVEKYLNAQNKQTILAQWRIYQNHFLNTAIQENIRNSKEEQYQGEFLIDLFVNVLGYTKNPTPNFNLTTELKNEKDSKKADGGIIVDDIVVGVIELKGTNTTDLNKIEVQAFGYKNNQKNCVYVITSNFEKLRFYIDNAIEYVEFNLFQLTQKEFELLFLCLAYTNISKNIPKKIKEESVNQENLITKKLYKDYSLFKNELFHNLTALNPQFDPLELFKKSQKLLDRFLFLFFAEDRQLLPPNSVRLILDQWKKLQELDEEVPLYDRYKKYFGYLNTGFKGKTHDVFAYNGGLFKPDEILDNIIIDDTLLYNHTIQLATYDFASEVDVNILGHIFENSLNELDEMKAKLEGAEIDKTTTKRKKDGVFYTPKYITKYIVENTVGKLCEEKKQELQLNEEEYNSDKKRTKATKLPLFEKLTQYRNWLLQITIIDPACGSGAFLNESLNFLIAEHTYIDELQAKLFGDAMILSDVEKSILENNLFGVDLNEESVEIAKLSLWLRTAQPNRKLNDLNNNIKCGNSLIDDVAIAGEKAFNWQNEFPQIFEKGGFDVVIGNPPYVSKSFDSLTKTYFKEKYETAQYQLELYVLFLELSVKIIKKEGVSSFIIPNSWMKNLMFSQCRLYLLQNISFTEIIPNLNGVFSDASVDTCIFTLVNNKQWGEISIGEFIKNEFYLKHKVSQERLLTNDKYIFDLEINNKTIGIFDKIKEKSIRLEEISDVTRGINPYDKYRGQSAEIIREKAYHADYKKDETFVPELRGKHINRYLYDWDSLSYVSYGNWLAAPREKKYFEGERILCRQVLSTHLNCCLIEEDFIIDQSVFIAKINKENNEQYNSKFIVLLFASKLIAYYFKNKANEFDALFPKIKIGEFKNLPIYKCDIKHQQSFLIIADIMMNLNKDVILTIQKFQRTIQRKFELEILPKKLQDWHLLSYAEFIKELAKKKIKLSLSQEAEWEDYFTQEAIKALALKNEIDTTDKTIDKMVYELYGLSEEEIAIVENS